MADYRVRLTLAGPLATPLHSGTLFGHLCWIKRYRDGEQPLVDWLDEQAERPLLLSDAFPAGYLPRPLLPPGDRPERDQVEKQEDFIARLQVAKKRRKRIWIAVEDFLTLRSGLNERRLLEKLADNPGRVYEVRQAHNTIDRLSGTTPESGGLYFMPERWHDDEARHFDIYVRTTLDTAILQDWFTQIGEIGFGRDASLGRGRFSAFVETADARLFEHAGNRLLSLSHGVISANMAACFYKLHTHYGKLGGLYGGGARTPFKYPLTLTQPGATFSPTDDGPYGELLAGVHLHYPEIRHHAFHLCLPYTEAAEGTP